MKTDMIPLDFNPLVQHHLYVFLAVFVAMFAWTAIRHGLRARYAGTPLVVTIVLSCIFLIPDKTAALALALAGCIVILIGRSDEIRSLSPQRQLIWQIIIALVLVGGGWTIPYVSDPFSPGVLSFGWAQIGPWIFPGSIVAILWLVFFMNAINWLDGVDGLAGSVSTVAFLALAGVSLLPSIQDPVMLGLALTGAAASLAFTLWNVPPAYLYLGTVGSWFLGLYLALTAMYGGGKLITAVLILALPALDALFVAFQRIFAGFPPWRGDTTRHLHHRLLSAGLKPGHITLLAALATALLAAASLMLSTPVKAMLIPAVLAVLIIISISAEIRRHGIYN